MALIRFGLIVAVTLLIAGCGTSSGVREARVERVPVDARAAAASISRYRAAHGLGPVTVDASLVRAAEHQAEANASAGTLSHTVGGDFSRRLAAVGFDRSYAAENLSAGATSIEDAMRSWRASPEHNRNLLMPQVQRIGIARADAPGSRYKRFWALVLSSS